ncbi:MAG: hypothetical protein ACPGN3_07890 [Opitutales bacterium]
MNAEAISKKFSGLSLGIGVAGIVIALVGVFMGINEHEPRNLISYLIGIAFWLSILVGMLFLTMIWHTFDAGWSVVVRRQLEHFMGGFKFLLVLFLPLLAIPFLDDKYQVLWKWMKSSYVAGDVIYEAKAIYLDEMWFVVRALLYFAVWIGLAECFRRFSFTQDKDGDAKWTSFSRKLAAPGLFFGALATTFAAFDWLKGLEFHWFSTMYGVWFFAGSMRAALAVTVLICVFLATKGYLKGLFNQAHRYFLGCLCLAFTVFWAYITFSQYFLIYMANIPEETFWYNIREMSEDGVKNSWWWVSMALIFGHFFGPFIYLLFYNSKIRVKALVFAAVWILCFGHIADLYFNILPGKIYDSGSILGYQIRQFMPNIFDLASILGIGGLIFWGFFQSMKKQEIIPIRDPRILESINYHE